MNDEINEFVRTIEKSPIFLSGLAATKVARLFHG
jgi:hypothetical protein